jgi:peptide/nickel transport system permease protein
VRRFIAARLAQAAIVVGIVTTIAFLLLRLAPGDPFSYDDGTVAPHIQAQWRAAFGYDRPVGVQLVRYAANVVRGDFGYSVGHRRPVRDVIATALPRTLLLAGASLTLAVILGIALGTYAAAKYRSRSDRIISVVSVFVYSIPEFWLALLIQMSIGFSLGWFPISGIASPLADYMSPWNRFVDRLEHMAMPVLTLTILVAVVLARYQRAALIDVLPGDFLRTARAKGATERTVVVRHGLRNALTSTITMLGVIVPGVLGGVYFIEYVFGWPGLGMVAVNAVTALDYDLATAAVVISGTLVALGSCAADILAALADPRIRDA